MVILFYMIKNLILVEKKKVATPVKANTRAVFDALMRGKRVGEIAREEIPPIVASKPYLVIDLLDPAYCDYKLNVSAPVLSTAQVYYKCGTPKYYASVNVTGAGNTYLLFMHWAERYRQALLDWIW